MIDTFDREDSEEDLGTTGTGQDWQVVSGPWGISGDTAASVGRAEGGVRMAVVPEGTGDGLTEVTMSTVEDGAGLVFRYLDPDNYWSLTANLGAGSWTATRVLEGQAEVIGQVPCQVSDGTTISVTQDGSTVRFLVEGQDCLSVEDGALSEQLQGGLIAAADSSGEGRWNRFLVGQFRETAPGTGSTTTTAPAG